MVAVRCGSSDDDKGGDVRSRAAIWTRGTRGGHWGKKKKVNDGTNQVGRGIGQDQTVHGRYTCESGA